MKKNLTAAIKYLLFFAAGCMLLWLAFRNENLSDVWGKMQVANPFWLGLSIAIAILSLISRAVRWKMLIEPLGYKPRTSRTLYALLIGYLANLAIPRIGEISRCVSLNKSEKVPFNGLIGTVIVERAIDLAMLFLCMALVAVFQFEVLYSFLMEKIISPVMSNGADGQSILMLLAVGLIVGIVAGFWFLKNKESRLRKKISTIIREVGSGLGSVLRMKNNIWFLFHTVFIWVAYFFMTYTCFFCLPSTSALGVGEGLFILVVGGLGMSAPVQGGIGAYHYIVSHGLQLFGVSSTDGLVYATLVHTTQTLLMIVLGAWALLMLMIPEKKQV
ncbi:MAG: lysylphosphatidylglycerol synthase transmembrane domain-containing protein [Bacteroidota bacterium]